MSLSIEMKPIGVIRTPYLTHDEIPIQGKLRPEIEAWVELEKEYETGLSGLQGFSYAILLYYFIDSDRIDLVGPAFLDDEPHGIFSMRSPHRPNHIGLTVVRVKSVSDNIVYFNNVDMIDKTPLLDIKPYVVQFDSFEDGQSGWIDKHFENCEVPVRAVTKG